MKLTDQRCTSRTWSQFYEPRVWSRYLRYYGVYQFNLLSWERPITWVYWVAHNNDDDLTSKVNLFVEVLLFNEALCSTSKNTGQTIYKSSRCKKHRRLTSHQDVKIVHFLKKEKRFVKNIVTSKIIFKKSIEDDI